MAVIKRYTFREKFSWALYDWANSVFATTVLAGFFPLFLNHFGQVISMMLHQLPCSEPQAQQQDLSLY